MAVRIEFPNGNNLVQYTPQTGGGITLLTSAQYIKGLNYYEYFFIYDTDFSGSCLIEQAPGDNGSVIKSISAINQGTNSNYNNISFVITSNYIRLFFTPNPGAPRTFFVRLITQ
jgi:hypothetical protein